MDNSTHTRIIEQCELQYSVEAIESSKNILLDSNGGYIKSQLSKINNKLLMEICGKRKESQNRSKKAALLDDIIKILIVIATKG